MAGLISGFPTASRLILWQRRRIVRSAPARSPKRSAILSNPSLESSAGSSVDGSISRASRSRIELAYSVRLSRCKPGSPWIRFVRRGFIERRLRVRVQKHPASARSGLGIPLGGIILRADFSIDFLPRFRDCCRDARDPVCRCKPAVCGSFRYGSRCNIDRAALDPGARARARAILRNGDAAIAATANRPVHWLFHSLLNQRHRGWLFSGGLVARKTPSAQTSGVRPCLSLASRAAPFFTRSSRMSSDPRLAAPITAVMPMEFMAFTSAPLSKQI